MMADMESFATTIATLDEELARLDQKLQQEEMNKNMLKTAISESLLQQEAHHTEIDELIKEIAELECQAEDASCMRAATGEGPSKAVQIQVLHNCLHFSSALFFCKVPSKCCVLA